MKKTHMDLVHTIKVDMRMMGFSDTLLRPLLAHESEHIQKPGPWFNNAENYKIATNLSLDAKLAVCLETLKAEDAPKKTKAESANMIFSPSDSAALSVGVSATLRDAKLLEQYRDRLDEIAATAESKNQDLRLDMHDGNITSELPEEVLRLLVWAESFDLSGNSFSNIKPGTALAHMVYKEKTLRNASMNWIGRGLTELDAAAKYLHSGELIITHATLQITELRNATELDLSGQQLGVEEAVVISVILPENTALTALNMSGNSLTAGGKDKDGNKLVDLTGIAALAQSVSRCPALASVKMGTYTIVVDDVKTKPSIDLSNKELHVGDALILAALLPANGALTALNLDGNYKIGTAGARAVAAALPQCKSLTSITFSGDNNNSDGSGTATLEASMTEVDISHKRQGASDAFLAAGFLPRMQALTNMAWGDVDVPNNSFSSDLPHIDVSMTKYEYNQHGIYARAHDVAIMADMFPRCSNLTYIELNHLGPSALATLAPALPHCEALRTLDLGGCWFTIEKQEQVNDLSGEPSMAGLLALASALPQCQSLAKLQMCSNGINRMTFNRDEHGGEIFDTSGITALAGALPRCPALELVEFTNGLRLRVDELKNNEAIDVSHDRLMSSQGSGASCCQFEDAAVVAAFLPENEHLTSFSISDSNIGPAGIEAIAAVLPRCRRLSSLDLSIYSSNVGATGARALAAVLPQCPALTTVKLSRYDLDVGMITGTGSAGPGKDLDLSGRSFGVEDAIVIAAALPLNEGLTSLDLSNNCLGEFVPYLQPGWDEQFARTVAETFDRDKDGVLSKEELIAFSTQGLECERDNGKTNQVFFCTGGPEARPEYLNDAGDMTVDGLVGFYRQAAIGRPDAVVGNMKSLGILSSGVSILCQGLLSSKPASLTRLDISGNDIGAAAAKALAAVLPRQCPALTSLKIKELEIPVGDIKTNKELVLTDDKLKIEDVFVIAAFLPLNEALASVKLVDYTIVVDDFKTKPSIEANGADLRAEDAMVIATLLPLNEALTSLDLSNNDLSTTIWDDCGYTKSTATGVVALAEALPRCPALTSVNLKSCGIGNNGANAIIAALPHCGRIGLLDLQENSNIDERTIEDMKQECPGVSIAA
jgi:Ran GTPase-activating protein (RanGAP) involved in mRNA processing and transport